MKLSRNKRTCRGKGRIEVTAQDGEVYVRMKHFYSYSIINVWNFLNVYIKILFTVMFHYIQNNSSSIFFWLTYLKARKASRQRKTITTKSVTWFLGWVNLGKAHSLVLQSRSRGDWSSRGLSSVSLSLKLWNLKISTIKSRSLNSPNVSSEHGYTLAVVMAVGTSCLEVDCLRHYLWRNWWHHQRHSRLRRH